MAFVSAMLYTFFLASFVSINLVFVGGYTSKLQREVTINLNHRNPGNKTKTEFTETQTELTESHSKIDKIQKTASDSAPSSESPKKDAEYHQFFLYHNGVDWNTTGKYCFIKPSETKDYYLNKFTKEEPLVGTIRYITKKLQNIGLKEGDEIAYTPDSEYEFTVEGEKLYRVNSENICILL